MLFGLFGKQKNEEIALYAKIMTDAAEEGTLEEHLEDLIQLAREKKLNDKELGKAQEQALVNVFESFCENGMLSDEDFSDYRALLDACYMVGETKKYKYTTIAKRCNGLYKIQKKGILPTMNQEYANIRYASDEKLHFAASASLLARKKGETPRVTGTSITRKAPYKAGALPLGNSSNGWRKADSGVFWMTTTRIGFHSGKTDVDIPLSSVEEIRIGEGVLQIFSTEGITTIKTTDYDMAGAIVSNLLSLMEAAHTD